jgi:trans-2,3-dihydro-3-hydroxyanthranilate isomerase
VGYSPAVDLEFRLVDVFAERPLAGNQLCVVLGAAGLDPDLMQSLAREIGFSETTFVTEAGGDRYAMRIFTPGMEMPFAGHPTLGTAFVLVSEGLVSSPATQVVAAGEFRVEVDRAARRAAVRQHPAVSGPTVGPPDRVAAAVGLRREDLNPAWEPRAVSTGLPQLMVPAASSEAVVTSRPDPVAIQDLLDEVGADSLYLFAETGPGTAKARMFANDIGVTEDPATGSAAGPCAAYLAERGGAGLPGIRRLAIRQGEEIGRPSLLEVDVDREGDAWVPTVGGGVHVVGRGSFTL